MNCATLLTFVKDRSIVLFNEWGERRWCSRVKGGRKMKERKMENGCAKGGREMKERDGEETRENNLILNKCICAMCLFGL